MSGRANQPRDLVWSLEGFQSPSNAIKFFEVFRNSFAIYSASVNKVYCDYDCHKTGPIGRRRLVILPDFTRYESIYNRITAAAVQQTSVRILPVINNGISRLMLAGIATSSGNQERLPLKQGLGALRTGYFDGTKILPTLKLGDLREVPEKSLPYLNLHNLNCAALSELSDFEKQDIKKACWSKLKDFY